MKDDCQAHMRRPQECGDFSSLVEVQVIKLITFHLAPHHLSSYVKSQNSLTNEKGRLYIESNTTIHMMINPTWLKITLF